MTEPASVDVVGQCRLFFQYSLNGSAGSWLSAARAGIQSCHTRIEAEVSGVSAPDFGMHALGIFVRGKCYAYMSLRNPTESIKIPAHANAKRRQSIPDAES